MRKSLTFLLAVVVVAFGLPIASHANSSSRTSSVTGRAIDVSGRAVAGQRVELLRGTEVVDVVTTSAGGDWMFPAVAPGDYVVRMTINNTIAGMRVTVRPGQTLGGNLLVAPAAAAAPQFGVLAGLGGSGMSAVATAVVTAASAAGSATVNTDTVRLDAEAVEDVLNNLDTDAKKAFINNLVEALKEALEENAFAEESQVQELVEKLEEYAEILEEGGDVTFDAPPVNAS